MLTRERRLDYVPAIIPGPIGGSLWVDELSVRIIFLLICEGERGDIKDSFCVVVITFDFDNTLLTLSVSL